MSEAATQTVVPTSQDRAEAQDVFEALARSRELQANQKQRIEDLAVSPGFARFLSRVLEQVAGGHSVTIGSLPDELTTTVAARELGVSRMTLMKWIREGQIASHKVGTHTRLMRDDVRSFRVKRKRDRRDALKELLEFEDELDLR